MAGKEICDCLLSFYRFWRDLFWTIFFHVGFREANSKIQLRLLIILLILIIKYLNQYFTENFPVSLLPTSWVKFSIYLNIYLNLLREVYICICKRTCEEYREMENMLLRNLMCSVKSSSTTTFESNNWWSSYGQGIQFSSVQSLCHVWFFTTDCSTPGFPVHHHHLELAQTHIYWLSDAMQPSCLLSSPSPPAFNLSQHQELFQWVSPLHHVDKVLELQFQHQSFQWIFRTDFL